jgi:hypothetical protein
MAAARGYDLDDCYAYSDSITDVPMLEAVGHPYAVNPDKALRRVCAERSWPVLTFTNAVPLRERLSGLRPSAPTTTFVVAGAVAGAAALAWFSRARRAARD